MKKLLIASLLLVTVAASAQDFRIGVKGTFYSTWLFNNNIADQGEFVDYAATFSPSFGATTALYFTENMAVSLDILYAANNQKLEPADGDAYKHIMRVKYLDLPLLLKISSDGGAYVELGPQFSLLMGANEDLTTNPSTSDNYTKKDFKNDFSSFGVAPVLGFGVDIQANDNLFVNIGLRFGYGIGDATKKFTEDDMNIDGKHSFFSALAHTDASDGTYKYSKTNRAFGGFTLGVIYKMK
jgi:Outer membrane protein beta-barrel domain